MKRLNQTGSHVFAIAVLVLALGIIGFVGFKVNQDHNKLVSTATTVQTQPKAASVPATITNVADLQQAGSTLDQSSSQLDSGLDDSSLSADLNSML